MVLGLGVTGTAEVVALEGFKLVKVMSLGIRYEGVLDNLFVVGRPL